MIILAFVAAYLLGSLPSAVLIGKLYYNTDVREHGSGNAGATNTFRVLGKKAGIIVFILDLAKGSLAALIPVLLSLPETSGISVTQLQFVCGLCAVMGHIFPVFAGFRGGKGVATMFGVFLAIFPLSALICALLFFTLLYLFHFVSLGSILSSVLFIPVTAILFHEGNALSIILMMMFSMIIIVTHRKNIERLLNGTENKMYLFKS